MTETTTISTPKHLFTYQCLTCNHSFNKPDYWTVENAQGYLQKIPYYPKCVSQNIEHAKINSEFSPKGR